MSSNLYQSNLTSSKAISSSFSTLSGEKNVSNSTSYKEQNFFSSKFHINNFRVTCADILWVIKCVMSHNSFYLCDNIKLLSTMFKDSEIASGMALGRTNCSYLINFGLDPYFKNVLETKIHVSPLFVISYDESMNTIFQNEQMDMLIRFWNNSKRITETRYFDLMFLSQPNLQNLFGSLQLLTTQRKKMCYQCLWLG